jgi:hypothetical protein
MALNIGPVGIGADHVAIQVLTAGDYHHGSLPLQQLRELAAALKART